MSCDFFKSPEKPPNASVNVFFGVFFAIHGHFFVIVVFPLGVFSIRIFNLHDFKVNENAPIVCECFKMLRFRGS